MYRPKGPYKSKWEAEKEAALKKAKEDEDNKMKYSADNFPRLGNYGPPAMRTWGKSFVALATEWKEADEIKKIDEVLPTEQEEFTLPRFNNIRHFVEEEVTEKPEIVADEWTYIERRVHIKKERPIEDEFPLPEEEESVWVDGPAEHETCWDERKH